MQKRDSFINIISAIRTTEERSRVYTGLEMLSDALFHPPAEGFSAFIDMRMPYVVSRPMKELMAELSQAGDIESVKTVLMDLRHTLENLPVLSLEVALEPGEETVALLAAWIRKNIGPEVIMELSVDRALIAGVRIAYEGLYKEVNLAAIIEATLRQKQESIHHLLYE